MSFGFPAYHNEVRRFDASRKELLRAAKRALRQLGWSFGTAGDADLTASVSVNWLSWGETLTVDVADNGKVRARSRCALPTQCFDWGKNKRNVTRFFKELELELEEEGPDDREEPPTKDRSRIRE